MASATLPHDGFLIPNASLVSDPRMAEPDQVDFNTIAHSQWGVVEGCFVSCSLSTVTTLGGTALVNGQLVTVAGTSQSLGTGGTLDRFDLVVVDTGGAMRIITGTASADPVFPPVPVDNTVLAAVFVPTGVSNLSNNVIDKRKFVAKALLTKIDPTAPLVQNRNGSGNHFLATGGGDLSWESDTFMSRVSAKTLRLRDNLNLDGTLVAGGALTGLSITVTERVQGQNLFTGTVQPTGIIVPGAIFQNETTGKVYLRQQGVWQELATQAGAVPYGTVIWNARPEAEMRALGWVALKGNTINETEFGQLFNIPNLGTISGTSPARTMVLPDLTKRVIMSDFGRNPGVTGGATNNVIKLTEAQLANHKHDVDVKTNSGMQLTGSMTTVPGHTHEMDPGGNHVHWVNEHPHAHHGFQDGAGNALQAICEITGGRNTIDALFNDRNHTHKVDAFSMTANAVGEVDVLPEGSQHTHILNTAGSHTHALTINPSPSHDHGVGETAKGSNADIDITPAYITMYAYIRT
jgi:microcystin-dependent protein